MKTQEGADSGHKEERLEREYVERRVHYCCFALYETDDALIIILAVLVQYQPLLGLDSRVIKKASPTPIIPMSHKLQKSALYSREAS